MDEVLKRMEERGKKIDRWLVSAIMREAFDLIVDATSLGENVHLKGFGEFRAVLRTTRGEGFKGRKYIRVYLRLCQSWRQRCQVEKQMEKYAYEKEKEKELVKEAAKSGVCPACGSPTSGNPPVCPSCGSKPFEKKDRSDG